MKRVFHMGSKPSLGEVVLLPEETLHKLKKVLKTSPREKFMLYGRGWWAEAEFLGNDKARVLRVHTFDEPRPKLVGAVALLKKDKLEDVVRFASQMMLQEVLFFKSRRSLVEKHSQGWLLRMEKIAFNFSPIPVVPRLRFTSWEELLSEDHDLKLIPSVWKGSRRIEEVILPSGEICHPEGGGKTGPVKSILFVIGPEGGFTEDEVGQAVEHGFIPVTLGKVPLFSETAFFYTSAVVNHILGRFFTPSFEC